MEYSEYKWFGFKTDLRSSPQVCDLSDPKTPLIKTFSDKEAYQSIFRFKEPLSKLKDIPDETLFFSDYAFFDFDSTNLELAFNDAKELAARLSFLKAKFKTYFSGNKGFHVALPSFYFGFEPTNDPTKLKNFCSILCSGLKTFDKSVYNKARVFRCPSSLNAATGMYKTEVNLETSLDLILEVSKKPPDSFEYCPIWSEEEISDKKVIPDLFEIYNNGPKYQPRVVDEESKFSGSIFTKAGEGNRNENAFTVARKLARRGITLPDAKQIMSQVWNENHCEPPLSPYELNKTIENAYDRGVNQVLEEGNYEGKISDVVSDIETLSKSYKEGERGFLTGYKVLDDFTMGFQPGETVTIAARSGNFKSALLTNILQRGSALSKKPALFFSMEMGRDTLVPRMIQQTEGLSKKQVLEAFRAGKRSEAFQKTLEAFKYVKFIYLSNLSTEQVMGLVDFHREKYGQPCAIGFDYLGLFKGCNNNTERTAKQAQEIKSVIAKASGCPVFTLAQVKQLYDGDRGDIELDRVCVKDSDAIHDLSDYFFGVWGHWFDNTETGERSRLLFSKPIKARGYDDEVFGDNPYFGLSVDSRFMQVKDIVHVPQPPRFKQKDKSQNE